MSDPFLIDNNPADMAEMAKHAAKFLDIVAVKINAQDLKEIADHLGVDFEQLCRVRQLIVQYIEAGEG